VDSIFLNLRFLSTQKSIPNFLSFSSSMEVVSGMVQALNMDQHICLTKTWF